MIFLQLNAAALLMAAERGAFGCVFWTRIFEITESGGGGIEQTEQFFERSCTALISTKIRRYWISGADPGQRANAGDVSLTARLE